MTTNVLDQLNDCGDIAECLDVLVLLCSPADNDRGAIAHNVSAVDLSPLLHVLGTTLRERLGLVEKTLRA